MSQQNLLLLAELKAYWHRACAHAELPTFGRTGGIGRVPLQHLLLLAELNVLGMYPCRIYYFWQNWEHWACAHAEFLTVGLTEGIGRVSMQNLLLLAELKASGVCPCGLYQRGPRARGGGGERGGDESDAMDAAPTAVWRRPAQPGRGSRIRCVRWNRLQALRHQTPDTREWMVRPSLTLMATVLVFRILACFSSLQATIESLAPVSRTAL